MISVIVCSRNTAVFEEFSRNVSETIGLPFEIIRIDNSKNDYSLCAAYNEGASKARFDCLCFSHEDIIMHTRDWGSVVISTFEQNGRLGLIGVAGSSYRTIAPASWGSYGESNYINILQNSKQRDRSPDHWYYNPTKDPLPRVACIDGVWFCTKKEVARSIPFDSAYFKGFHCYDIDFSLAVQQQYEVAVTFEVLIEHFSEGSYNRAWIDESIRLQQKWKKVLPVNLTGISAADQQLKEKQAALLFSRKMIDFGYSPLAILRLLRFVKQNIRMSITNSLKLDYGFARECLRYLAGKKS